jgi:D-alanyl-D-alanine dipeptidase
VDAQAQALVEEMQRLAVEQEIHAVTEATDQMAEALAAQAEALKAALRTTGVRPDVERELRRLEAALVALRVTRSPGASADRTPAPAPKP